MHVLAEEHWVDFRDCKTITVCWRHSAHNTDITITVMNRSRKKGLAPCQQVISVVLCFSHRFCRAESCMEIWSSAQKRLSPWLYKRGMRVTRVLNKVWRVRHFWARCACSCDHSGVNTSCSTAWPAFTVYQRLFYNTEMLFIEKQTFPGFLEALTEFDCWFISNLLP